MFNISEFSSVFKNNGGGQKTNLFSVEIPICNGLNAASPVVGGSFAATQQNLKFYCEATELPGMQLATSQIRRYGYGPSEEKPFMPIFSGANMRFIGDGGGSVWNYFQAWLKFIINTDARNGVNAATGFVYNGTNVSGSISGAAYPYEVAYKQDYAVDITISLYNKSGNVTIQTILRDAFPKFIGDIPLSWGDNNNIMRIPIQFSFMDWYNNILAGDQSITFAQSAATVATINTLNIKTTPLK